MQKKSKEKVKWMFKIEEFGRDFYCVSNTIKEKPNPTTKPTKNPPKIQMKSKQDPMQKHNKKPTQSLAKA